ncbi:voltage-dependent calcium channel subunit alpha-2/delta-4 isoform X3 [Folsomia candida]|uniref:voltage-dependent calcium channel subunit alpha-2/delta-4 isoform X3 n=1 Tax=Folsomia candida TaxID=158441 RepID=UPI0016053458|nr:voltage-dependent calcium channel subunit alpha-2/delta-4 isoform X3 [Folsomia candida]
MRFHSLCSFSGRSIDFLSLHYFLSPAPLSPLTQTFSWLLLLRPTPHSSLSPFQLSLLENYAYYNSHPPRQKKSTNHNDVFQLTQKPSAQKQSNEMKTNLVPTIFSYFCICCTIFISRETPVVVLGEVQQGISKQILENWASKFGGPLFEFGRSVTKYNELQGRFSSPSSSSPTSIRRIELDKLITDITSEMNTALKEKVEAVRKIMLFTEERSLEHHTRTTPPPIPQTYYNAKKLNRDGRSDPRELFHVVNLTFNAHFGAAVNTSFSSIHVPTSIYEKKTPLLEAIGWTSQMDSTFESNYQTNPTLSYQYFGSATGFLRQYPAGKWPNENGIRTNPDLYDARTRQWYVSAATSPKNMVILQDISGSMTGLRREIAKHVVSTILDTLTENDYVNVYSFAEDCTPVVPCFTGKLVQANLENIRDFKDGLDGDHTTGVANFSAALNTAFDILEKHLPPNAPAESTSSCNQAIMIITDGSPYNFEEIFKQRQNREYSARIFTYLIGRDVTDKREVMYMACANNGYYTHVSTLSEVQEQVLKYIPVMARPLVLYNNHSIAWTSVYADVAPSPKRRRRTYWLLRFKEPNLLSEKQKKDFHFVITASVPVFDTRNVSSEGSRIASLLGVAGTDIPIRELHKIASPFKLGVNGYSFLTNNNGYVIYHPDHRPIFRDELLKPNYNTVDMMEVELMDGDEAGVVRNNYSKVVELRQEMIELDRGYRTLNVKVHQDGFRRVTLRPQKYEFSHLKSTPYTLTLSVPAHLHQFHGQMELYLEKDQELITFFGPPTEPRRWSINPTWSYCEYIRGGADFGGNKEDQLVHFLKRIEKAKKAWKWKNTGVGIKQRHGNKGKVLDGDIYECDRDLLQSLAFDANVTEVFTEKKLWKINREDNPIALLFALMPRKLIELNGASLAFIATRSGLTRWIDFEKKSSQQQPPELIESPPISPTATDSIWYKRAVERYLLDPDSFVFSVPFNSGGNAGNVKNDTKVTATRAVFVTNKEGLSAPVAVVGVQYKHEEWAARFFDITSTCVESSSTAGGNSRPGHLSSNYVDGNCKKTCESGEYDCYVLDDNGFVLISEKRGETGRFFGEIDGMVMEMLVNSDVYKRVRIVDHQAVCFQPVNKASCGVKTSPPHSPHLPSLLSTFLTTLLTTLLTSVTTSLTYLHTLTQAYTDPADQYAIVDEGTSDTLHPFLELASINKTRLRPCDKETFLYTYGASYNTFNFSYHGLLTKCGHSSGCDGYFNVHFIPHTNLILVVTDGKCRCGGMNTTTVKLREVDYPPIPQDNDVSCSQGLLARQGLFRERPADGACVRYNANEMEMDCGGVGRLGGVFGFLGTFIVGVVTMIMG